MEDMSFRKYSYDCRVWHGTEPNPSRSTDDGKLVEIIVSVYVADRYIRRIGDRPRYHDPILASRGIFHCPSREDLLFYRSEYTDAVTHILSLQLYNDEKSIAEEEQRLIVKEFSRVAQDEIAPSIPSKICFIYIDVMVMVDHYIESAAAAAINNAVSSIEGLEKVRIEDEGSMETAEATSCVICMEEDLITRSCSKKKRYRRRRVMIAKKPRRARVAQPLKPVIARLPCTHLFHGNCILQWLEKEPFCPLCRYQVISGTPSSQLVTTLTV